MFPVRELALSVLRLLPLAIVDRSRAIVFWMIVFLSALQYRRLVAGEERIYGAAKNNPLQALITGLLYGIAGGLVASVFLVFIGVSLSESGISYLLPLAFLLYMISPRLMCFSYAGGIISLSHLIFGIPKVSVPGIMALVGVLHITESALIWMSGDGCSTPVYLRNKQGRLVGGFGLQRFWPMPLVALVMVSLPGLSEMPGLIQMPDWWPLVRAHGVEITGDSLFVMVPIVAALGYSDFAITCMPGERIRRSAAGLAAYSVALLSVAIASTFVRPLEWVAALFGPLGHEAVIMRGSREELSGEPAFVPPGRGVMILDVMPGTPAHAEGLRTGDIITEVSGEPVNSRQELRDAVQRTPVFLELSVEQRGTGFSREIRFRGVISDLGIITVPEEYDRPHVELQRGGIAGGMVHRLVTALRERFRRR